IIPVAWLLFALEYTGRDELITVKTIGLLCIVPVFTSIMVATNPLHYLFYTSVTDTSFLGLSYHIVSYGPAFWIHAIYSYLLIGSAILLILQRFLFSSSIYRRQVTIILIATLIPLVMNLILVFRIGSVGFIDPTPVALLASGILIMIGMVRFQLLDITPIAHEQILAHMRDGVIVIDIQGRIISLNGPAGRFLGIPLENAIGLLVTDNLPGTAIECLQDHGHSLSEEQRREAERVIDGKTRFFEMRWIPILTRNKSVKGRMILIRDITESRQTQVALSEARRRITLLSSFTRHDILNQVTGLLLNIDMAKESVTDPAIQEWLKKQEAAVQTIQRQIEFTRDYEELGTMAPEWISVRDLFLESKGSMDARNIVAEGIPEDLEIFADPLLKRVFSILVDNAIQHGERVTKIRISYEKTESGLTLVVEDNGVGIAAADKNRIFERGVGRKTGLGLFLAHEILGVTGMAIRECGEPGKGARFEIQVPAGHFRIVA
ncbi:MAG TPA: histidine kinase N-terminal 7TM domain-containing protein, partial [Methanoregula sp.]|nr:histidine kinase N-terminal 7TM domain-containing protein [Methanoregula sp.]